MKPANRAMTAGGSESYAGRIPVTHRPLAMTRRGGNDDVRTRLRAAAGRVFSPKGTAIVRLWSTTRNVQPALLARLEATLSPDEQARARSYRSPDDAARFTVTRGMLRVELGDLLRVAPHEIQFAYGACGKPYIWQPRFGRTLGFNVSHSEGLSAFGCLLGSAVGIDVERLQNHSDLIAVAAGFFSPREMATLIARPRSDQTAAFFRCWTRKEAYIKAIGTGLQTSLDDIHVAFGSDQSPAVLRVGRRPFAGRRWRMDALDLPPGYVGAVVAERPGPRLPCPMATEEW